MQSAVVAVRAGLVVSFICVGTLRDSLETLGLGLLLS
jgi:hypothetical protein